MIIEMRQTERNQNIIRKAMQVAAKEEAMRDVLRSTNLIAPSGWELSFEDLADAIDKAFQYAEAWNKLLDNRYAQMCLVTTPEDKFYAFDTGIDGANLGELLECMEENGKLARLDEGGAFIPFEKDNIIFIRA